MRLKYLPLVLVSLLFGSCTTRAGIRPSFDLDTSSWEATDIVVATEGKKIDGLFRVLEVWKGDLSVGSAINVPALASFAPESSRLVKVPWDQPDKSARIMVSGQHMVLFLKREDHTMSLQENTGNQPRTNSIKWSPTGFFDEFMVSVAWIEAGKSFAFVQLMNPGPSLLIDLGESEEKLKSRAFEVNEIQRSFLQATTIADPTVRAAALEPFAHHSLPQARQATFTQLSKCDRNALPVVRRMLADDSLLDIHSSLVQVLAEVGKNEAGPDLVNLLEKDKEFWTTAGPSLEKGWWNGAGFDSLESVTPFRDRYSRDYEAVLALAKRPYRPSAAPLADFRNFWRSYPQLAEIDQLSQACDEALREVDRLNSSTKAIRFEGLRTFGESELLRELHEKVSSLSDNEAPVTPEIIEKAKGVIGDYLALHGHLHARITGEFDQNSRSTTFVIDEGAQARISEIEFHGNEIFPADLLRGRMTECLTSLDDPGYDFDNFDYCLRRLNSFVRSKGYLEARLGDPTFKQAEDGLIFTINVDEGKLYRLGKLSIKGSSILTPERVREMIGLKPGDTASGEQIGEAVYTELKIYYANRGYVQYTAEINPTFKDNPKKANEGIVNIELTIDEGKQFTVRSIKFVGENLPYKVLSDLFAIRAGDVFNEQLFEQSIQKVNEAGLFAAIDKDKDVDFGTDEAGQVSLTIKVNKDRTGKMPR